MEEHCAGEPDRSRLRETMRRRRRELPAEEVARASTAVVAELARLEPVRVADTVAGYRSTRGEIDVGAVLDAVAARGGRTSVPRVVGRDLEFVLDEPHLAATTGSYGISQPVEGTVVDIVEHDVVIVPLVAFDSSGGRLGQGGGFYDRALAPVRSMPADARPLTVGVAHTFQQVERVPLASWDVPLDLVVTEHGVATSDTSWTERRRDGQS